MFTEEQLKQIVTLEYVWTEFPVDCPAIDQHIKKKERHSEIVFRALLLRQKHQLDVSWALVQHTPS